MGQKVFSNEYAIAVEFSSLFSGAKWTLTTVYGPCDPQRKIDFLNWLHNIDMPDDTD